MATFDKKILSLYCAVIIGLVGCTTNYQSKSFSSNTAVSEVTISDRVYQVEQISEASSIKVLDYKMPNVNGKPVKTSALVLFPQTPIPKDGYKVVVWLHGTLGVSNNCAPTENKLNARFKSPLATSLLKAGYVIIAPDYEGLGGEGIHPYLNMESEAKASVYAVQAAQQKYVNLLNPQWMSVGQSQGGQASLATAEYIAKHPDPNYKGIVAAAPASNLDKVIFEIAPQALAAAEKKEKVAGLNVDQREQGSIHALATLLSYASFYGIGIKSQYPNFDYLNVFSADRVKNIAKLSAGTNGQNGLCLESSHTDQPEQGVRYHFIQDIKRFLKENPNKSITDYPTLDRQVFYSSPEFIEAVKGSNPGFVKIEVPLMIIQGTEDMAVPYYMTEKIKNEYVALGSDVEFIPVKGANHSEAIVQENQRLIDFIKSNMPAN